MKKFKFLVKNSLLRKLKSKGFIISTIITSFLILVISVLPGIISKTDEGDDELPVFNVLLINETTDNKDIFSYLTNAVSSFYTLEIKTKTEGYEDDLKDFYESSEYDVIVQYVNGETTNLIDVSGVNFYSKLNDQDNNILQAVISSTKYVVLDLDYTISIDEMKDPNTDVPGDGGEEVLFNPAIAGISTMLFTIIFMFIIFSIQTLGAEILEEKSTKAIETIISSVPAKTHFYSKILSNIIFTAIQLLIMLITGLTGLFISNLLLKLDGQSLADLIDLSTLNVNMFALTIISILSIILGVVIYLIIFAFFASFANNNEEYQKSQSPLMIILLIVFYGSIFLASTNQVDIIRVLAYVPLLTPFLLPISMLLGKILIFEAIIIIIVLFLSIYLLTKLIVPIYRVSILDYSGDKLLVSIKRSYKSRKSN